jgi:peptide/nickel transport system ATP-binding protein
MESVDRSGGGLATGDAELLLDVRGLTTAFRMRRGIFPAIRNLSFTLAKNETLALVGESGCGKSMTALSIMRLVPEPAGRITGGEIWLDGTDLLRLPEEGMRKIRGNRIAMIFQEPMTSLNPVLTVGRQIAEALAYHQQGAAERARERALELMEQVKIPSAARRYGDYPHQFSGGMRQRVMIAMALACRPSLILADEPTTALDVTIQAQILCLLADLKREYAMSMVFITHNLGIVAAIADRVAVMYAGQIVEVAPVYALFEAPRHPYTELLLRAVPRIDQALESLSFIPGQVPPIDDMPSGCRFAPRCPLRVEECEQRDPELAPLPADPRHLVRCWVRGAAEGI